MGKDLKSTVINAVNQLGRSISKHTPEILAGIGIGCWATTTVTAVKATPKAVKILEEKKKELNTDKLTVKETVSTVGKLYLVPAISSVVGTACIIGSVAVGNRRYLVLSTAYQFAEETARIYRDKVIETIGEKKEAEIQGKVAEERLKAKPSENNQVLITGKGESLCFDSLSGRYFKFDIGKIKKVQNDLNSELLYDNYVSVNSMYSDFGLDPIDLGYELGWSSDMGRLIEFDLSSKLTSDDEPCLVIDYNPLPSSEYYMFNR